MTKELKYTVTTCSDIFNLWTTDPAFRVNYPYLPDLKRFVRKYKTDIKKGSMNGDIYNYLVNGARLKTQLIEYMKPYIIANYMIDGKLYICHPTKQFDLGTICVDISYMADVAKTYNYVIKCTDISSYEYIYNYLTKARTEDLYKNNLLDITKDDGNPIEYDVDKNRYGKSLYALTGNNAYKPTAFCLLSYYHENYMYYATGVVIMLEYIKEHNCVWTDHPENHYYNVVKNNKELIEKENSLKCVHHLLCIDSSGKWHSMFVINYLEEAVSYAKEYGYDVNKPSTNGSYLVHYAAQQSNTKVLADLLDMGATLVNPDGSLLLGLNNNSIFEFSPNKASLLSFLDNYYKDNKDMLDILNKIVICSDEVVSTRQGPIDFIVRTDLDYEEINWSSIPDTSVRQDMQVEYMKLYLKTKGIEV